MKETRLTVRITFTEDLLGTSPSNPEIYREYIASKAPDAATIEDEVKAVGVDEVVENGMTVFARTADGTPFIYDYHVRGYCKEICAAMRKIPGSRSSKIKAFKKEVDSLIFVEPREIKLDLHGLRMDNCQRSLRASTAQGDRTALANSEAAPAGTTCEFTVVCMVPDDVKLVREWLDYGKWKGFGQWRNSGKGKFTWEELDCVTVGED